jgi:16S rRNA processing protein RimM
MFSTRFVLLWWVVGRTTAFLAPYRHRSSKTSLASTPPRKKKKNNKYEQFSKVKQDTDPLQELLAESERKLAALQLEQQQQRTVLPITAAPPKQFPDTATIDPYDPRTFGYVTLGTIQGAHGVQGWIKVKIADAVDAALIEHSFTQPGWVHVRLPNKRAPRPIWLQQGRATTEQQYLLQLHDIVDREQAQTLRGATLYVRHEQIVSETDEEEEEYDVSELVGMAVFLAENSDAYVGKVSGIVFCEDISSIPLGHDFLELELPRTDSGMASYKDELVLIPFVPPLVPIVDVQQRRIHIDPPTGLLDLTYVRSDKVRVKGFLPASRTAMD